jgi:hypothetical protein
VKRCAGRPLEAEQLALPLEGAGRARISLRHGAGRVIVTGGAGPSELLSGAFGGGVEYRTRREGDSLDVELRVPRVDWFPAPWMWGPGREREWSFRLNDGVPLALGLRTGANDMRLDLSSTRVTDLRLDTGASSTEILLPAQAGRTRVDVRAGAASLTLRVPDGVAARIRAAGGASDFDVDRARFPRADGSYQSADYDTAPNRVEITIQIGAGSVEIR